MESKQTINLDPKSRRALNWLMAALLAELVMGAVLFIAFIIAASDAGMAAGVCLIFTLVLCSLHAIIFGWIFWVVGHRPDQLLLRFRLYLFTACVGELILSGFLVFVMNLSVPSAGINLKPFLTGWFAVSLFCVVSVANFFVSTPVSRDTGDAGLSKRTDEMESNGAWDEAKRGANREQKKSSE